MHVAAKVCIVSMIYHKILEIYHIISEIYRKISEIYQKISEIYRKISRIYQVYIDDTWTSDDFLSNGQK